VNVTVHLHTILQRQTPEGLVGQLAISLPENTTMAELLDSLEIELEPEHLLLVVNGRTAELQRVLQDGDQVNLMPAISGG
jgi:sulfur carrier protein ThiS